MILELSKLKNACPDQLAPFDGLWNYERNLDYFDGTIFRFPLRSGECQSMLSVNKNLDGDRVRSLMDDYFHEARISLLFLREIRALEFKIHGKPNSGWTVNRESPISSSFFESVVCSFTKSTYPDMSTTGTDKWWVAIQDVQPKTKHLPFNPRRKMKNVEAGIAALVSSQSSPSVLPGTRSESHSKHFPKVISPRMFNVLPLPFSSDLPVHIHATFALYGDRQSIIVDEHGQESYAKWNRYLLESALPELYLAFLEELGRKIEQDEFFSFWPQEYPAKKSCAEILFSAFWKDLPQCTNRLFPKTQLGQLSGRRRAPPEIFDVNQAIFDFLPTKESDVLVTLLLSAGLKLVRHIPRGIAIHLRNLKQINCVTGSMLRELLKLESNGLLLQNEMAKNGEILSNILERVIADGDEILQLDGCRCLPLANGMLGTLTLLTSSTTQVTYYVALDSEMELFQFSSALLLSAEARGLFRKILESQRFNLKALQLCDVQKLLENRIVPTAVTSKENIWLTQFWDFWNHSLEPNDPQVLSSIDDFMLYRATCNDVETYIKPAQFQQLPAVVQPVVDDQKPLAAKIPGLYRLDRRLMPRALEDEENSFHEAKSFYRYINVVKTLAAACNSGLGAFLKSHLDLVNLKVASYFLSGDH